MSGVIDILADFMFALT